MNTQRVNAAAGVIHAAMEQGRTLPASLAYALESAQLLQSPESAAELERLRRRVAELETSARGCDGEGCVLPHSSWCTRAREFAAQHSECTCGEPWKDTPQTHAGHCWLLSPPDDELEWHRNRVAELLARVAELEVDLNARGEDLAAAVAGWGRARSRVAELEAANSSLIANRDAQIIAWLGKKAREYGTSNRENRAKAEAVARMADKLSRGAVRQPLEDPHDSPLHHDYRLGHDLPEIPSV